MRELLYSKAGTLCLSVCRRVKKVCYRLRVLLTSTSLSLFLFRPRCHGAAMPGSPAYQLKNQLSVIAIQELRRDILRNGESNEMSDGEEGGVTHFLKCSQTGLLLALLLLPSPALYPAATCLLLPWQPACQLFPRPQGMREKEHKEMMEEGWERRSAIRWNAFIIWNIERVTR